MASILGSEGTLLVAYYASSSEPENIIPFTDGLRGTPVDGESQTIEVRIANGQGILVTQPEPSTVDLLLGIGAIGLGLLSRRD